MEKVWIQYMADNNLYEKLSAYGAGDTYPFHMPGHKRNPACMEKGFPGISLDITEIHDFDNLHHAEGILREAQRRAADLYQVKETFYSVNGSTAALLAAISAAVKKGSRILVARNCHKAVYHAIYLRELVPVYVYPQWEQESGLSGGISPLDVDNLLKKYPDIQGMILTSPTYDGIVSDVKKIAEILHKRNLPLIVDEAHGAHFRFSKEFPTPAEKLGADLVIQSVHKTLPSLTQTALLHRVTDAVDAGLLKRFLGIYQSSSPSYLLMASMDQCMMELRDHGEENFEHYVKALKKTRENLKTCRKIQLISTQLKGVCSIYDMDISKLIFSVKNCGISGKELSEILRQQYHLEMEMETEAYVLAITSVGDTEEGFQRLVKAILEIDQRLEEKETEFPISSLKQRDSLCLLEQRMIPAQAMDSPMERIPLEESAGKVTGEFAYLYPPGIPLMVPGERISLQLLQDMRRYQEKGFEIQGLSDYEGKTICVLR